VRALVDSGTMNDPPLTDDENEAEFLWYGTPTGFTVTQAQFIIKRETSVSDERATLRTFYYLTQAETPICGVKKHSIYSEGPFEKCCFLCPFSGFFDLEFAVCPSVMLRVEKILQVAAWRNETRIAVTVNVADVCHLAQYLNSKFFRLTAEEVTVDGPTPQHSQHSQQHIVIEFPWHIQEEIEKNRFRYRSFCTFIENDPERVQRRDTMCTGDNQ
jgi:hypothetical protein